MVDASALQDHDLLQVTERCHRMLDKRPRPAQPSLTTNLYAYFGWNHQFLIFAEKPECERFLNTSGKIVFPAYLRGNGKAEKLKHAEEILQQEAAKMGLTVREVKFDFDWITEIHFEFMK